MTPRKRWPNYAEEYRTMSIKRAGEIVSLCEEIQRLLDNGNRYLVLFNLAEVKAKAKDIQLHLIKAKGE